MRRRPQQLLPAGDARADGALRVGVGERSRGVQLPPGRLHADQPRGDARAGRHDLRAAEGDRLRVGVRRGRSRIAQVHAGHPPRLAGEEHHVGAAREARRLREQHGVAARPREEGDGARRRDRRRRRGDGLPFGQRRDGDPRGRDRRPARSRATRSSSPWVRGSTRCGTCCRCRRRSRSRDATASVHDGVRMWHYMALQEGTLGVDPDYQKTNDGGMPPVLHVDTDAPLYSDRDGHLITDKLWGIYYKPDFHFGGVQGGAMPAVVKRRAGRGARRSLRPEVARVRRHRQFRRHVDVRARVLPEALRRPAREVSQRRAVGRHRLLHAGQLSGVRSLSRQRAT